jgi:hypothetical protein
MFADSSGGHHLDINDNGQGISGVDTSGTTYPVPDVAHFTSNDSCLRQDPGLTLDIDDGGTRERFLYEAAECAWVASECGGMAEANSTWSGDESGACALANSLAERSPGAGGRWGLAYVSI